MKHQNSPDPQAKGQDLTGLARIASLLLPEQKVGNLRDRFEQTKMLRKTLIQDWIKESFTDCHSPGSLEHPAKLKQLPRWKASAIMKVRCQSTITDAHEMNRPDTPCECAVEKSSKHIIMECPKWTRQRRTLYDKIQGPPTWENWLFTNLKPDLIFDFARAAGLIRRNDDGEVEGEEEEDTD